MVSSAIALNYHVDKTAANQVYRRFRQAYTQTIIDPTVQESVKAATAQFTAEELITRRPESRRKSERSLPTDCGNTT